MPRGLGGAPPPCLFATFPNVPQDGRATPTDALPFLTTPASSTSNTPCGSPISSATRPWDVSRLGSSSHIAALMQRCMPRLVPPSTWRARGSMAWRSRARPWPTMEWKTCSRGSRRAPHPRHWSWNAWSASRNPSTSHGVRANCGREHPASSVRGAGNICCLLVGVCAFGGSVDRENQPVKHRCRCRVSFALYAARGKTLSSSS